MTTRVVKWGLAVGLVLMFANPVHAGTNVTRVVSVTYQFPAIGQGDLGGACLDQPPPVPPQLGSCMTANPNPGEDHLTVNVTDSSGSPVYISIRQAGNPERAIGCGTIVDFPIMDMGAVRVSPWAGPGLNDLPAAPERNDLCVPGSLNGGGGDGTFTFYDDVPPSSPLTYTGRYNFPSIGQGDVGGFCISQPTSPPIPPQLGSCVQAIPPSGYNYVDITAIDDNGDFVYITVQQDNNPNFASGCGTIEDFPNGPQGPGGGPGEPIMVFPWAGPGLDRFPETLDPNDLCRPGSTSLTGGTVTLYFHD